LPRELLAVEAQVVRVGLEKALGVDGVGQHAVVLVLEAGEVAFADLGGLFDVVEGEAPLLPGVGEYGADLGLAIRRVKPVLLVAHDA
jgi:hypothetical protein